MTTDTVRRPPGENKDLTQLTPRPMLLSFSTTRDGGVPERLVYAARSSLALDGPTLIARLLTTAIRSITSLYRRLNRYGQAGQ
jgi:hypothetical protein